MENVADARSPEDALVAGATAPTLPDKPWESGLKEAKSCSHVEGTMEVYLQYHVWAKIARMNQERKNEEWLAYLVGEEVQGGIEVVDLYMPEQEATPGAVDVHETAPDGIVGTYHWHHGMGAFHSGTDSAYVVANHSVCIVGSEREEWKTTMRLLLPCGRYTVISAKLVIDYPEVEGLEAWVTTAMAKIRKKVYTTTYGSGYFKEGRWHPFGERPNGYAPDPLGRASVIGQWNRPNVADTPPKAPEPVSKKDRGDKRIYGMTDEEFEDYQRGFSG